MGTKTCTESEGWKENQEKLKKKWKEYRRKKEEEYYKNPKLCKKCNNPIKFSRDVKRKTFCGKSCSNSFNNLGNCKNGTPRSILNCLNCNKKLPYQKKYCSNKCQGEYQYKKYIEKWKKGEINGTVNNTASVNIRKYIFTKFDSKCVKCGWNKTNTHTGLIPLHIDHIDGNSENNKEENLDLLCPSCHSLTSNYGSRNKGNSKREYRNKWRKKYKKLMGA